MQSKMHFKRTALIWELATATCTWYLVPGTCCPIPFGPGQTEPSVPIRFPVSVLKIRTWRWCALGQAKKNTEDVQIYLSILPAK